MFKTSYILTLLGSVSADTPTTEAEAFSRIKSSRSINDLAAKATPVPRGYVTSAAAVTGDWMTYSEKNDGCSSTATPSFTEGYKMGYCANVAATPGLAAHFAEWSCSQDAVTSDIVLVNTRFTESTCITAAEIVTYTMSATCDQYGGALACTLGTDQGSSARNVYANGLTRFGYDTMANCESESTAVEYEGNMGCINGENYGKLGADFYNNLDCTGAVAMSLLYSAALTTGCSLDTGDDDYYDDWVSFDLIYNEYSWGGDGEDDEFCFHVESEIDYKGVKYTYEELKAGKESECTVPHSPSSKGVVISTSCDKTVRVTDTHLMATTKGFQLAYSLKAGDVLFGDYDKEMCVVKSIEKEKTTQQYFGLNCVHSEVLASGLRASTFGDFHTLPSWYMTYVGGLVGSESASFLGEYIAEWYFQK